MKKKKITKIILLSILAVVVLFIAGVFIRNATLEFHDYLFFDELDDGTYRVTNIKDSEKDRTEIVIPSTFRGKPVTQIREHIFDNMDNLEKVVIPGSITSVNGFIGCTNLREVVLEEGIVEVSGFQNCTSLTQIALPESLETIGTNAFANSGLTSIVIPEGVVRIEQAFGNCSNLTNVSIPNTVYMMVSCFYDCTNLTYNEYEGCLYLGNANNPYLCYMNYTSYEAQEINLHPDTQIIHGILPNPLPDDANNLVLPDRIQFVTCLSFSDKFETITIPKSFVGFEAGALNSVERIIYKGTMDQWKQIITLSGEYSGKVICSDGEIN